MNSVGVTVSYSKREVRTAEQENLLLAKVKMTVECDNLFIASAL
jgi:hypothetical protein